MLNPKMLDEMSKKVSEALAQSPVKDIDKNLRPLIDRPPENRTNFCVSRDDL